MRVGVITLYHNSNNYGGNLQAYALCKAISELEKGELTAEQISYDFSNGATMSPVRKMVDRIKVMVKTIVKLCIPNRRKIYLEDRKRKKSFKRIRKITPHSKAVYNDNTIQKCVSNYDVFITGSDQVWNPDIWTKAFLLEFVPKEKVKASYAASIAQQVLTEEQKREFANCLKDYKAISVRENLSVDLISDISPCPVEYVLDPTLLLSSSEWDAVCDDRLINDDYVFIYFLGKHRRDAEEIHKFAKEKKLKIVEISGLHATPLFNDVCLSAVSPEQFISLIKYASYVITDSFHATVFSWIYKRQFFVINRDVFGCMNSRIYSLLELFERQERFLENKEQITAETFKNMKNIDYTQNVSGLEEMREKSISYLKRVISRSSL